MKKFTVADGAALVIWLLPAIYLWSIYPSLPAIVPVHWDIHGAVDRYGSKQEFLLAPCILMAVSAGVFLLMRFLPNIDPKKQVKFGEQTFNKIALGIVVFTAALDIAIIYGSTHKSVAIDKLIFPMIGLLYAFLGNMFNNIKPNYFAGFRTPWALEDEDNWRATHRFAGKIWFIGGLIMAVTTLLLPTMASTIVFMSAVGILVFVPIIYSYSYFKKHQADQNL
jgi:uncharacterized membrane protein